jgi:SAM-dependent methyltransferase
MIEMFVDKAMRVKRYFVKNRNFVMERAMDGERIKDIVRSRYAAVAVGTAGCCGPAKSPDAASCDMGYSAAELAAVPEGANLGLGCGNPQALAALRPGEIVIDLGSGAGFDCFLAARQVGPHGRAIGIDMTHEMLKKARDNAARAGVANVEFRLGEIEHLPIADNIGDVVISNCVINLVPDKAQVYREAFRVLKPGGRIAISDVVNTAALPAELVAGDARVCGCIAGAASSSQIEDWLSAAGFTDIRIRINAESRALIESWAHGRSIENYIAAAMIEAHKPISTTHNSVSLCCGPQRD